MPERTTGRRAKVIVGSTLIGAAIGIGLRVLLVGKRPAVELIQSGIVRFGVFFAIGSAAVLVVEAWYRQSPRRGLKFALGLVIIGAAVMWFVPIPA